MEENPQVKVVREDDEQANTESVQNHERVEAVSPSSSQPNNPWLISVLNTMKMSVVHVVPQWGSTVRKDSSSNHKPPPPPKLLLSKTDMLKMNVEATVLVDKIKNNSVSLVQDLKIINRKLANYPWLKNREDIRDKLLRKLHVLRQEGGGGDPGERVQGQTRGEGDAHQPWCEGA